MNPERISKSGLKTLQVLLLLRGHVITGMSNTQISKTLEESPSNINRYLNTLISVGFAKRREDGLYSMDVGMLSIAEEYANEVKRVTSLVTDTYERMMTRN